MPELDGIRGIAILLVLAGHLAEVEVLAVAGVTLFFVLSGYLITGVLRTERDRTGTVDLRAFYIRRARRLLPALAALLVVLGGVALLMGSFAIYLGQAGPAAFYVANLARAAGHDLGPLNHTWSLALEEQFYLVWPIAFLVIPRRWLAPLVALLVVLSLAATTTGDAEYAPLPRVWAILAGCLLAPFRVRLPRILAARPLVRAGQLSYALYLWHFPLVWAFGNGQLATAVVIAALSLALALISERWIERPFRSHRARDSDEGRHRRPVAARASVGAARP